MIVLTRRAAALVPFVVAGFLGSGLIACAGSGASPSPTAPSSSTAPAPSHGGTTTSAPASAISPAAVAAHPTELAPPGGEQAHLAFRDAYAQATQLAEAGDFEKAASAFVVVIPELAKHRESADEFWAHNAMMMIREAQGDPAAALVENDQATLAAARGKWNPEERETLAYLKDRWHRAYLTRMLAESRKGSVRQALIQYAEAALDDYRRRARELGSNEDSIAVLEAYFAALDGNAEAARTAARKVDPAKDDDVEDLYLVVVGCLVGRDLACAEEARRVMRQPQDGYLARPIMLRWLEHDAKPKRDAVFTPWHAS